MKQNGEGLNSGLGRWEKELTKGTLMDYPRVLIIQTVAICSHQEISVICYLFGLFPQCYTQLTNNERSTLEPTRVSLCIITFNI